ncbi:MAG: glycosyltransferase [Proteobacteria bacterium]|nr:glycosyltransferase [Pseudomonadota bacterium]
MLKNNFVFISPMYNASKTLSRMLHSICGQSHENWKLILIDDVSSPSHLEESKKICNEFKSILNSEYSKKIINVWNTEKKWEVSNVLTGISMCDDDDIICRIDADDWLTELDALSIIDAVYQQSNCDILWTAHRWGFSDKNISGPMSQDSDPYKHPWVTSHLKTFRKKLLNDVKDENYRGEDGNYIRRAGDQAIYLPALYHSKKRIFLPRVMYHYTINDVPETYQTDDAIFQRDEAVFMRNRGYIK